MPSIYGPRFTRIGALLLAVVATFGVAMPRARVTARERVGRAVAIRLGSPRINDRLGWVAPDPRRVSGPTAQTPPALQASHVQPSRLAETFRLALRPAADVPALRVTRHDAEPESAGHRFRTFGRPPPIA